jgi:hypothetical protein
MEPSQKRKNSKDEFEKILLEAIDEALFTLGQRAKTAVYITLEKKFNIKPEEIPRKIEEFSDILETLFGLGARHLEILSMRNLHIKICKHIECAHQNWSSRDLTFKNYVENMKTSFLEEVEKESLSFEVRLDECTNLRQRNLKSV